MTPPPIISFVLPCFHKAALLRFALPHNQLYANSLHEVVLVLDAPDDEAEILAIVKEHPEVKFRVLVNDTPHEWRPPCSPINVGVRNALGSHIAILSPETIISAPAPYLASRISKDTDRALLGMTWALEVGLDDSPDVVAQKIIATEREKHPWLWGYGFLMVRKDYYAAICGMDESRRHYGEDDTDLRVRLGQYGVTMEINPQIRLFHVWHEHARPHPGGDVRSPTPVLENQRESWGREFSRVAYDWAKA